MEIKNHLGNIPKATIVNPGCGLMKREKLITGLCDIVNIDFPDVISVRERLIRNMREKRIFCDLN